MIGSSKIYITLITILVFFEKLCVASYSCKILYEVNRFRIYDGGGYLMLVIYCQKKQV